VNQIPIRTGDLTSAEIYRLLTGLVVPRPIALVSTLSKDGRPNLAPFSFFTVASADPPVVALSIGPRFGNSVKDTLRNIKESREFVINVVTHEIALPMNMSSLDWGADVDEFVASGLTPRFDNVVVKAPRVVQSPAHLECRLMECKEIGTWTLVLGEVLAFHCSHELLGEGYRVKSSEWRAIGRLAGVEYCETSQRFAIQRDADTPSLDTPPASSVRKAPSSS
jgi:flavin reductase (DIM6/NTAB) family NADH-FMN oxidoreductase RutF